MPAFLDLDDEMQDALDATYGERVRITPQGKPGWRTAGGADVDRPIREIVARYRSKPIVSELEGQREGTGFQSATRFASASHTLRVSPTQIALYGHEIRANDRVALLDRADAPSFTITSAGLRDSGEMHLGLVPEGAPAVTAP